jgi:linoleoyl-CoA desaturase
VFTLWKQVVNQQKRFDFWGSLSDYSPGAVATLFMSKISSNSFFIMQQQTIRFSRVDKKQFFQTLRRRVNDYFEQNQVSKTGNWKLYLKTFLMYALYLAPFVVIMTVPMPTYAILGCYLIMGLGMASIGLCVMHDANHGTFSKNPTINKLMSYSMEVIGGSSFTWKIQHNILHHSFTNVYGMDEDIHDKPFLRLSPEGKLRKYHRFQHIYAALLYCFATISWTFKKDFVQLANYHKSGTTEQYGYNKRKETIKLIIGKTFYMFYTLALPMLLGVSWWVALVGFVLMHMVAGLWITIVFQLAHVVEGPDHHATPESGKLENTWAIHQLKSTANFATKSKFLTYILGGLNFQVEHHLFPNISHVHYTKISEIVRNTAKEFDLPYYEYNRFMEAVASHVRVLKALGAGWKLA